MLIVVDEGPQGFPTEEAVAELQSLCLTAGIPVGGVETLKVREPNATTYFGKGKVAEIAGRIKEKGFTRVVLNLDFSGIQQRNLKDSWGVEILDRTSLILQIFSKHAHSAAGKLQVELARENYLLSRMTGRGILLSRLGGGIGTRGPGEMKLEEERRRAREHIQRLETRIAALEKQRQKLRDLRKGRGVPEIALVGYTNAGKSTLFNALTRGSAYAADQLFATLDTTTRRVFLTGGTPLVLSDTVGFIRQLPHTLVAAFRATLEEAVQADLLLHVVDAGSSTRAAQIAAVNLVLAEIGADRIPQIMVYNKIDLNGSAPRIERDECGKISGVWISARTGSGLDLVKQALEEYAAAATRVPVAHSAAA